MFPLDPQGPELDALLDGAHRRVRQFLDHVGDLPAVDPPPAALVRALTEEPLPEAGRPVEEVLDRLVEALTPGLHTSGPGYLAFVPGGGLPAAGVADWMALTWNRFGGMRFPAPSAVALEDAVLRWLAEGLGLPAGTRGLLTSGGSVSNLGGLLAARSRLGDDFQRGVVYYSAEAHRCVPKSARVAGFPARSLRPIPVDGRYRMDVAALAAAVAADRAAGLVPLCVVASAGTTNTGAVDPLVDIAALCRAEDLWMHVDGAYGGCFALCEDGRRRLPGFELADSWTLDPHKGMFLPYGTGCLLLRDLRPLQEAHAAGDAAYLRDVVGEADYTDLSPELSREVRGARLWLPLQLSGMGAFREALAEKLALAERFHEGVRGLPGVTVLDAPQLSVVAFRGPDDPTTERWLRRVNERRRVHLSSSVIGGRVAIRCCVLSFRTHAADIDRAVEDVAAAVAGA